MALVSTLLVFIVAAAAIPTLAVDPPPPVLNPPLVGFSFSPAAVTDGQKPERALARLLHLLQPDLVRLPVYWSSVAPTPTSLNYSGVDRLIATVQAHNGEMQATPWIGTTGFTRTDLLESAAAYRGHGVSVFLLWGVEDWLDSPAWIATGLEAIKMLRQGT